ncbi:hypothetical protein, partial [Streptomyces solincola]|uniref:hypothetical protein n=1 Tax=Streptomyces solincola TaxID=2100817 RepID=UPI002158D181
MSTHDHATETVLLESGAVLPPAAGAGRDDADTLTARSYTHAALGDRRVVRLVPGTLGEAEDLALEFLGLAREPETPEVGRVRRETLGFPAWALVNDPANGRHALALVKDVERLARQAKSRAGAAKEGFEALADRLGRAVPHFLPTFYEQAARVFLQHGNTTYAAAFFGKAREAERVHGLAVDEERQRAVFLEFAFAGALTVKALKEHVRDLTRRLAPAEAWAQYRQLAVERCAAGMTPYASLPQDARGLIKAAGLDRVTEECALVADLIASPAVVRAPRTFWTAYRTTLAVLARRRPETRVRLLEILPRELGSAVEDDEWWLTLLAETGATALLTGEDGAPAALPGADAAPERGAAVAASSENPSAAVAASSGDPSAIAAASSGAGVVTGGAAPVSGLVDAAEWLGRWAAYRKHGAVASRRSPATLDLVARMADRLRADGRPVDLFTGRWRNGAEPDLLDLCVATGIPLAAPPADAHLPLDNWLQDTGPGRRDLTALGAAPHLRGLLHRAVGSIGESRPTPQVLDGLAGHPVLRGILHDWLDDAADALAGSEGLPGARAALTRLRPFRAVAERVNSEATARVAAHQAVPLLARTLRAGILDELGWPALDEAWQRLAEAPEKHHGDTVRVGEAWPALILSRGGRAVVVGPDAVLLEHDLRIPGPPDRWRRPFFRYTDGELLVIWWHDDKQLGYWSNRPGEVFRVDGAGQVPRWWDDGAGAPSLPLPTGGRATGARALHAGDTALPPSRPVLGDGTGYWREGRQSTRTVWLEYDPATGAHGRASLPAFLRSGVHDGARLVHDACELLPLQPGLEGTPFGTDGTVLGRWVRTEGETDGARTTTTGTPDGRTVTLAAAPGGVAATPLGALELPGAAPLAALTRHGVTLLAADATTATGELGHVKTGQGGGEFAAGTRYVPPVAFWHALRPRDRRGSDALRALTDAQTADLLRTTAQALARHRAETAAQTAAVPAATAAVPASTGRRAATGPAAPGDPAVAGPTADEVARLAVSRALPALTDVRLLTGVAAIVRAAVRHAEATTAFTAPDTGQGQAASVTEMFADLSPEHGDDDTLGRAVAGLSDDQRRWYGGAARHWTALRQIRAVNHVLSGSPAEGRPLPGAERLNALTGDWTGEAATVPATGVDWLPHLTALRPLAYRAASPALPENQRQALLQLFDALAAGPLAAPTGRLREVVLAEKYEQQQRAGQVLRRAGRTVVILGQRGYDDRREHVFWLALDHDPAGAFGAVAHFTLREETERLPGLSADVLAAVTGLVRAKGAAPWQPAAVTALADACAPGLGPVQAALLTAALPRQPDPEALAATGLTSRGHASGRELLATLDQADQLALVAALLPEDPEKLWTSGPDTAAAARLWDRRLGSRVRVTEDVAAHLTGIAVGTAEAVLNPAHTPWLSRTTVQRIGQDGGLVPDDPAAVPAPGHLASAVQALAALAYHLPHGHPLRAALPAGLAALRDRIADPGLLLDLHLSWTDKGAPAAPEIRKAYGLPPATDPTGAGSTGAGGTGTGSPGGTSTGGTGTAGSAAQALTPAGEALVLRPWYGANEAVLLRPAALTGPDDPVLGLLEGLTGARAGGGVHALRTVLGDDLARAVAAGATGETRPGHAQDPTRSVPGLVAEAAARHGLSEDAAALYLQILALPDPTDRNCVRWSEWRPART